MLSQENLRLRKELDAHIEDPKDTRVSWRDLIYDKVHEFQRDAGQMPTKLFLGIEAHRRLLLEVRADPAYHSSPELGEYCGMEVCRVDWPMNPLYCEVTTNG